MGHMKKILIGIMVLSLALTLNLSSVEAREGTVSLSNENVACRGVSIYQNGYYRVSGRCDGLVYPFETTYNKYVLWGKTVDRGEMVRIAEIDRGYFSGNIASAFESMYVTAEQNGLVRRPSNKQVLAGVLDPFSFDKSQVTTAPSTATTVATSQDVVETTGSTSTAGAVVGKIVSSLLVVILVIVVLAIGASLIFRSRGSVSA